MKGVRKMKLVELLALELKEWPDAEFVMQDRDRWVGGYSSLSTFDGVSWSGESYADMVEPGFFKDLASDHHKAIVARSDWEAERARIAAPERNANKDGWIRHRGGKCPVDKYAHIEYRLRSGQRLSTATGGMLNWEHGKWASDIMAYRLHKPAEQVEPLIEVVQAFNALAKFPQREGPLKWRDRITEIDATTSALATERAELVQKLASEGFALIGRDAEPVEDMSDWRNWKVGDRLVLTASGLDDCEKGEMLTIDGLDFDDDNQPIGAQNDNGNHHWPILKEGHFKTLSWHSRPSA